MCYAYKYTRVAEKPEIMVSAKKKRSVSASNRGAIKFSIKLIFVFFLKER